MGFINILMNMDLWSQTAELNAELSSQRVELFISSEEGI